MKDGQFVRSRPAELEGGSHNDELYCTAMMITRMITGIVADFPLPRFCMDRAGIQDKVGYGRN